MILKNDVKKGILYHKNYYDFIIVINHDELKDIIYYLKGKFDKLTFEQKCYNEFIIDIKNDMLYEFNLPFVDVAIEKIKKRVDDRTGKLITFFSEICCFNEK